MADEIKKHFADKVSPLQCPKCGKLLTIRTIYEDGTGRELRQFQYCGNLDCPDVKKAQEDPKNKDFKYVYAIEKYGIMKDQNWRCPVVENGQRCNGRMVFNTSGKHIFYCEKHPYQWQKDGDRLTCTGGNHGMPIRYPGVGFAGERPTTCPKHRGRCPEFTWTKDGKQMPWTCYDCTYEQIAERRKNETPAAATVARPDADVGGHSGATESSTPTPGGNQISPDEFDF